MKHRLVRISIFIICLLLIFNLVRSLIDMWKKGDALNREEERFAKVRFENEELIRESEKLQNPDHIEREARDKLGLARPGETVVIIPETTPIEINTSEKLEDIEDSPVWRQWLDFLLN